KNLAPLDPFTSGVSKLLCAGTGRVYLGVVLGLDEPGGLEALLLLWHTCGKNMAPLDPFTSGVSTLLYAGTGRVCLGVVLGLDGPGGLEALLLLCHTCG
ncbi:hypothetical protein A2U01_0017111, partial [Trifolium medium]|nr:hypothetical protein [Trifolium medium]